MRLRITADALEQLGRLSRGDQERLRGKIEHYAAQKDPLKFAKHLTGHDAYRFRIGDYRVIFITEGDTLVIIVIAKRDDAYKDI